MKAEEWNEGLNYLDSDLVENYVKQKDMFRRKKKVAKRLWLRWGALAACLALLVSAVLVAPMLQTGIFGGGTNNGGGDVFPNLGAPEPEQETRPDIPIADVQATTSAPLFYGNGSTVGGDLIYVSWNTTGISVTARFVEMLPDTYTFYDDWSQTEFQLMRMEVTKVIKGMNVPEEFLFIVPLPYMTDFSIYDKILFADIGQYAYEYSLLYNQTKDCPEQLETVLFGYSNLNYISLGIKVMAFRSNGKFDMRLWESTDEWKNYTDYAVKDYGVSYFQSLTLQDAEEEASKGDRILSVHFLPNAVGEAADALNYVKSLENGVYVQELDGFKLYYSSRIKFEFRRYINGFATNESGKISADEVNWSKARFSKEDEQALPNLRGAMTAISDACQAGEIALPHIDTDAISVERQTYGVFGWYAKTEDGVIGIVRVTWEINAKEAGDRWTHVYNDDTYYIVEYGSDVCKYISRDALLKKLGDYEATYIYAGEYDERGKVFLGREYP